MTAKPLTEFFGTHPTTLAGGPLAHLRETVRLGGVAACTVVGWVLWHGAAPLGWIAPAALERIRVGLVRAWARGVSRALALRVEVRGTPPAAPFVLVTNHLSYLDVIVLRAVVDGVFVAKEEVRTWPVFGALAQLVGTLFVPRRVTRLLTEAGAAIAQAVEDRRGVILFAEGTSTDGRTILPLRTALLDWAARRTHPVHVATIWYDTAPDDPPARDALCWWGDMSFLPHLRRVARLRSASAVIRFSPHPVAATDRQQLGALIHQALCDRFTPIGEALVS